MGTLAGMPVPPSQPLQMPQIDPDSLQHLQETIAATPWDEISKILRSNARRLFMVDVETDDTAFDDEESTKENALDFMKDFVGVLGQVLPVVQAQPILLPLAKEIVMFTADAFKVGQSFDDTLNDVFDKLAKIPPPQPGAAPHDPKAAAAQMAAQAAQQKAQSSAQLDKARADNEAFRLQTARQDATQKQQQFTNEMQQQAEQTRQDVERHQADMQTRLANFTAQHEKNSLELDKMRQELAIRHQSAAIDHHQKLNPAPPAPIR